MSPRLEKKASLTYSFLRGNGLTPRRDFGHDAAESGRKFRALSVVDPYARECPALEVDTSMGSRRVARVLESILAERGVPQAIRSDNWPEFTSRHFLAWCAERDKLAPLATDYL